MKMMSTSALTSVICRWICPYRRVLSTFSFQCCGAGAGFFYPSGAGPGVLPRKEFLQINFFCQIQFCSMKSVILKITFFENVYQYLVIFQLNLFYCKLLYSLKYILSFLAPLLYVVVAKPIGLHRLS